MKDFRFGDAVTIALVMAVGVILMLFSFLPKGAGAILVVESEGGESRYSLAEDSEFNLISHGYTLHIIIKDHAVWVDSSDCDDGVCTHMGKIDEAGETIFCVPSRVALRIVGEVSDGDAVAG